MDTVSDLLVAATLAEQEGFRATCNALQNMVKCTVCPLVRFCDGTDCLYDRSCLRAGAGVVERCEARFDSAHHA